MSCPGGDTADEPRDRALGQPWLCARVERYMGGEVVVQCSVDPHVIAHVYSRAMDGLLVGEWMMWSNAG